MLIITCYIQVSNSVQLHTIYVEYHKTNNVTIGHCEYILQID